MRLLLVGDVHSKVEDLEDCRKLADVVEKAACEHQVNEVVFLGDMYDTHAIVHVEVQKFWMETIARLREMGFAVILLVGNHDRPGNANLLAHALQVHAGPGIKVVDRPYVTDGVVFMPYFHDREAFVRECQALNGYDKLLVCHQTFDGAKYDNGFYAKDGVDPKLLPQKNIVSGHIHTPSKFSNVWYPGAPRWFTVSDANISRALHVIDVTDTGYTPVAAVATDPLLRKVWWLTDAPDDDCTKDLHVAKPGDKVVIDIKGPQAFIEERKRVLAGPDVRIRTFPTDRSGPKLSEADGIPAALKRFMGSYQPKYGTSKEVLGDMLQNNLHV